MPRTACRAALRRGGRWWATTLGAAARPRNAISSPRPPGLACPGCGAGAIQAAVAPLACPAGRPLAPVSSALKSRGPRGGWPRGEGRSGPAVDGWGGAGERRVAGEFRPMSAGGLREANLPGHHAPHDRTRAARLTCGAQGSAVRGRIRGRRPKSRAPPGCPRGGAAVAGRRRGGPAGPARRLRGRRPPAAPRAPALRCRWARCGAEPVAVDDGRPPGRWAARGVNCAAGGARWREG